MLPTECIIMIIAAKSVMAKAATKSIANLISGAMFTDHLPMLAKIGSREVSKNLEIQPGNKPMPNRHIK